MIKHKVWWAIKPDPGNYGDVITPYLFDKLKIPYTYSDRPHANVLCIGSIARFASRGTIVLGSGIISAADIMCSSADWRCVRGPLTRQLIIDQGGKCPEIYGDPALLLPRFCKESVKKHDVGIIPHYVDYTDVLNNYPSYPVINLLNNNIEEVTKQITECRSIISSSLHGIIVAHAYGIPAAWVQFSDKLYGDGIKFEDHFTAMQIETIKSTMDNLNFTVGTLPNIKTLEDTICSLR